ncbi:EAL domain-containing protein [Agaribacterium haliotis]|uniref:EAL domain-containing protein n=1 Tax=Agaribacterium haliotis TaxID=2013869 RepID=UPI000BB53867|nr:EAL domain-containing protein [Agaribacterium haliotis]
MATWYLEGYFDSEGSLQRRPLLHFPIVLGRERSLDCCIQAASISRQHCAIELIADKLQIEDLNSRNGTFVNRERISALTKLNHGDVLHLGDLEFRLIEEQQEKRDPAGSDETSMLSMSKLSERFPCGIHDLEELMAKRQIEPVYQPIVDAKSARRCGNELLSRSTNANLSPSPIELYRLAESFSLEIELSELMRDIGVETAAKARLNGELWLNTHPAELKDIDRLLSSLTQLKQRHPNVQLLLEIHEQAITDDLSALSYLKQQLNQLDMRLAFDDFGVGQSRLIELVEAKPDIIKFDRVLIAGLKQAGLERQQLVQHLVELVKSLHILTLAEGVGNLDEYQACAALEFELYQGFHFCRPQKISYFQTHN